MHEEVEKETREAFQVLSEAAKSATKGLATLFTPSLARPSAQIQTTKKRGAGYTRPLRNKRRLKRMQLKKTRGRRN